MSSQVIFFPKLEQLSGNPYWWILSESLRKAGCCLEEADHFSLKWIYKQRGSKKILHFHYIQQMYGYKQNGARLDWVFRFARNLILARRAGLTTVFTVHNLKPTYSLHPQWIDYLGHWFAINLCKVVILHSDYAKLLVKSRYHRNSNFWIIDHPNYIGYYPDTLTQSEARSILNIAPDEQLILFFGGIRPNKGIETLIKAFQNTKNQNSKLIIAGKPWPPQTYYESLVKLSKLDKRICWHPYFIPIDKVQVFFKAADIVVLPFTQILTSGSVNLSLSFGKPVIVPEIGDMKDLIHEEFGLLYNPVDPDGLETMIKRSYSLDLPKMGRAAYDKALSFTWERFAQQTINAYEMIRCDGNPY